MLVAKKVRVSYSEILTDGKNKPILIQIQMKLEKIMRYHYHADY